MVRVSPHLSARNRLAEREGCVKERERAIVVFAMRVVCASRFLMLMSCDDGDENLSFISNCTDMHMIETRER